MATRRATGKKIPADTIPKGARLLGVAAGFDNALDHIVTFVIGVCNDRETVTSRLARYNTCECGVGAGAEQRTELGRAVNIEQHQLAAIRWEMGIECRYDSPRAHREIDERLKSEDRRQLRQFVCPSIAGDPLLQSLSQTIGIDARR